MPMEVVASLGRTAQRWTGPEPMLPDGLPRAWSLLSCVTGFLFRSACFLLMCYGVY